MRLATLHLENLRNIRSLDLQLDPGFNYIHGDNGAGKTAILEALHLLARGRSFRSAKTDGLIQHGADSLLVRCTMADATVANRQAGLAKARGGPPQLRLDGQNQQKASSLAQVIPVQALLPDAADLLFGAPSLRRGFLDWGLFHVEQDFLQLSNDYRRSLAQRNAWLKQRESRVPSESEDPWLPNLVSLAVEISARREAYLDAIAPLLASLLAELSDGLEVTLSYDWGGLENRQSATKKMSDSWPRDVKFGLTHRGPHRADVAVTFGGEPAAEVLSRGQAKLVASAAFLAQARYLYERLGVSSIVLIDDFGAELDVRHWRQFVRTLEGMGCQVLATSTEVWDGKAAWVADLQSFAVFHVKQGALVSS